MFVWTSNCNIKPTLYSFFVCKHSGAVCNYFLKISIHSHCSVTSNKYEVRRINTNFHTVTDKTYIFFSFRDANYLFFVFSSIRKYINIGNYICFRGCVDLFIYGLFYSLYLSNTAYWGMWQCVCACNVSFKSFFPMTIIASCIINNLVL